MKIPALLCCLLSSGVLLSAGAATPLIELSSDEGARLLAESGAKGDFFRLIRYFNPQGNLAYCGVASSVMVLNALPVPKPQGGPHGSFPFYTQENFFTQEASAVKAPEKVAQAGMSLAELTDILNAHAGVKAEKFPAYGTTLEAFRTAVTVQLDSPDDYVLVNYHRRGLGQEGGGHISPVAAWHQGTDRFLLLDVSQYKYPPVWVPAALLWRAMEVQDGKGPSRGYVVVGVR